MSWYNPASWDGDDWKRVGLGVATGGQSETFNALTGKPSIYDNVPGFSGALGLVKPEDADLSGVKAAQAKAFGLTDALGTERSAYVGAFDPRVSSQNIDDLVAAAAGRVASPAELQLKRQAAEGAANQFGLAAALQANNPGAALRSARIGSQHILSDANLQAAQLRAQEQAAARGMLTNALSGVRGQDIDEKGQLLTGQLGALKTGSEAASAGANASATAAGAKNQYKGALIGGGAKILAGL